MATVTVHTEAAETPSQKVIADAKKLVYISDGNRKIGLRRLDFVEEFRIVEALGPQIATNTTYMSMLNPLLHVAEIDGDPIPIPRTKLQAEALIQRVGRSGYLAVLSGITEHFAVEQKELEEKIKNVESTLVSATASGS